MSSKVKSGDRKIASIFKQSQNKSTLTHEWDLSSKGTWIVKPFDGSLSSVDIFGRDINCSSSNAVKVHKPDKIIFYVTKNSMVKCKTNESKKVKVDYHFYKYSLSDINSDHLKLIGDVLEGIEKKSLASVVDKIKDLGLDDLYEKEISIDELKNIPLKEGDYVRVNAWPQLQIIDCPDGECRLQANLFGLMDFENLGKLKGMNQLKYQDVPPFIFFCGSRYTAGNIYFRADERMEFEHIIDQNGFSCDANTFLLGGDKLNYKFNLKWISRENLQTILMGKKEEFIKQKNNSQYNRVAHYISELQALNSVQSQKFIGEVNTPKIKGHIELWWEQFDRCAEDSQEKCYDKEMVMTRSRIIYSGKTKKMAKDIHLIPIGLKKFVESKKVPVAFVVKLCPEDIDHYILDQMVTSEKIMNLEDFKQHALSFEKKSCYLAESDVLGKGFNYRWLLASVPREVEKEEVELLIEDYQVLETPSRDRLRQDPFQKGKIFFDIYMKNLKNRELLFKHSRIIEVVR